ncbi:hypothetical protein [Salinibacterium sp. ZJ450]|uniref:hypothetical protein n=1 Tax=Salinibacterium sp. ZJ450 TaxID=2708338 RepID=UPI00141EBB31|nr:hypothetical protein [Salinibacterium sp. ZJ450]
MTSKPTEYGILYSHSSETTTGPDLVGGSYTTLDSALAQASTVTRAQPGIDYGGDDARKR